ncbi:hypothetical protein BGW37DRAFT_506838 [Umbelopsis sp. PMI_123]|nr:hypothetical protein BGW37DRAFT_506838 [Umbelopsis sp. PMI_123]
MPTSLQNYGKDPISSLEPTQTGTTYSKITTITQYMEFAIGITNWNCIRQQKEWSDRAAYNMYETIIKSNIDRFPTQKAKKQCNGWITLVSSGTGLGKPIKPSVWKNVQMLPVSIQGRLIRWTPFTDFVLVSPFQIIFDPQLVRRQLVDDMLTSVRDLDFMRKNGWLKKDILMIIFSDEK